MADLNEIGDLLERIAMHYPVFTKQIVDSDGKLSKKVAEEWHRIIGFLDYEDLIERLDKYMDGSDGRRPPMAVDFKTFHSTRSNYSPQHTFDRIDKHGRLVDADGRIYAYSARPNERYHYSQNGMIVDSKGIPAKQEYLK